MGNRSRRGGLLCISFCNFLFKAKLSNSNYLSKHWGHLCIRLAYLVPWRPEENASTLLYPRISSILQLVNTMASSDFFHHKGQWLLTEIDKVSAEQTDIAGQKEILMLPALSICPAIQWHGFEPESSCVPLAQKNITKVVLSQQTEGQAET